MLHTHFLLELTWELRCEIVEPKNRTPYETWAGNLSAHVAKCMEIQNFITICSRLNASEMLISH